MRLIIDTDAGIDDAVALMMALKHPGATVEAITTSYGNVSLDKVIPNVFTVLDTLGCDVPVYAGATLPLVADWQPEPVHGADGLGEYQPRPATLRRLEPEHAVSALMRMANAHPGELTLVALGPHTNIALACLLDPTFPSKIKEFIFMGGTIRAHGNTDNVTAEWNIFCDPEAAYRTLAAFPFSRLISWETTLDYPLTLQQYADLCGLPTPTAAFFAAINDIFMNPARSRWKVERYLLADPLAMAVALDPAIITKSMRRYVTVELHGTHTRGQTVIDHTGRLKRSPNVEIVTDLDMGIMFDLLQQALA